MAYAIVKLGGKQYRVREGERLTVDRLPHAEDATFEPDVLLIGGEGKTELAPGGVKVTARIVEHGRGPKIRIGKYRPKNGYKKHSGFRAAVSQVVIESIGTKRATKAAEPKEAPAEEPKPKRAAPKPKVEAAVLEEPKAEAAVAKPKPRAAKPKAEAATAEKPKAAKPAAAKPKAAAKPSSAAKKPSAKKKPATKKDEE
jgi:large subunit ribosomal protein L21